MPAVAPNFDLAQLGEPGTGHRDRGAALPAPKPATPRSPPAPRCRCSGPRSRRRRCRKRRDPHIDQPGRVRRGGDGQLVVEDTVSPVPAVAPNATLVSLVNPVPVTVTAVPPAAAPAGRGHPGHRGWGIVAEPFRGHHRRRPRLRAGLDHHPHIHPARRVLRARPPSASPTRTPSPQSPPSSRTAPSTRREPRARHHHRRPARGRTGRRGHRLHRRRRRGIGRTRTHRHQPRDDQPTDTTAATNRRIHPPKGRAPQTRRRPEAQGPSRILTQTTPSRETDVRAAPPCPNRQSAQSPATAPHRGPA